MKNQQINFKEKYFLFRKQKPHHLKVAGIVLLFISLISISFTSLWEKEKADKPERLIIDYSDFAMCAPINTFKIEARDVYSATQALAPNLEVKWKTNLNITSQSEEAKSFFNQGLFYLYAFNHAEADRSFKEAIRLDPKCAMCHWGVALGLGPNINKPMSKENYKDAYNYTYEALALSENCSDKEKALIKALTSRYVLEAPDSRSDLDSIYADEMRLVSQRFREDIDIAVLFVESLMNCMPWQYWLPDGQAKMRTKEALAVLDYIAEKEPNHPGANHFYIHVVEEVNPDWGTASADKLAKMDFQSGHLVHMPSHIYIRTGRYHDASVANQQAMKVDEAYIERCNIQGIYPAAYYPHNIHFLWFASTMEGRYEVSIEAARKLVAKTQKKMFAKVPSLERYFTMPYFSLVRFGKWDEMLEEPKPDENLIYANLMWHYARGIAFAKKGKLKQAKQSLQIVAKGSTNETIIAMDKPFYPTISMVKMALLVLKAEIEGEQNNLKTKVTLLKEAVAIQDNLIYDEPPQFYYPIRQSLGAALLANKEVENAEIIFKEDLAMFPKNAWSLFGLHQSLIKQRKMEEASEVELQFKSAWSLADVKLEMVML